MGILDDAIREHLDLKRQHGAREEEVRSLEDSAFGSGDRPDPFGAADLFGQSAPPGPGEPGSEEVPGPATPPPTGLGDAGNEEPTRLVEPQASAPPAPAAPPATDESPPAAPETSAPFGFDEPSPSPSPGADVAPPPVPEATQHPSSGPAEGSAASPEAPAPPPEPPSAPNSEPEAPAADVLPPAESLADLMAEEPEPAAAAPEPPPPPPESAEPSRPEEGTMVRPPEPEPEPAEPEPAEPEPVAEAPPSDEADLLPEPEPESQAELPPESAGVPDPPPPPPEAGTEPPGRARGRVHHATEEHPAPEPPSREIEYDGPPSSEPLEPAGASSPPSGVFDFESDAGEPDMPLPSAAGEPDLEAEAPPAEPSDEFDELGPPTDEQSYAPPEDDFDDDISDEHPATEVRPADTSEEEDLLSGSPDFIEESDDDEDLWFEKGPPKDFDFEDDK